MFLKINKQGTLQYLLITSPQLAAQWVNWLIEDVNSAVKAQDVSEAEKSIEYLREQVTNTSRRSSGCFLRLIQSQTETVMLAEVRQEYVSRLLIRRLYLKKKVNLVGH